MTEGIRVRGLTFSYPKSPEPAVHGLLRRDGVDQVTHAPWQIAYALVYPGVCLAGVVLAGQREVRSLRDRAVGGAVMAMSGLDGRRAPAAATTFATPTATTAGNDRRRADHLDPRR